MPSGTPVLVSSDWHCSDDNCAYTSVRQNIINPHHCIFKVRVNFYMTSIYNVGKIVWRWRGLALYAHAHSTDVDGRRIFCRGKTTGSGGRKFPCSGVQRPVWSRGLKSRRHAVLKMMHTDVVLHIVHTLTLFTRRNILL